MNAQVQAEHFKLTLNHYHRMIETGIFGPDDRLELIEGELIAMVPPNPPHAHFIDRLAKALSRFDNVSLRVQNPITLPEDSEPQPDLALVLEKSYFDHHPLPEDVKLIIEISDTTLAKDKQIKLPLYARYRIPETWILNVPEQVMEVYGDPVAGEYVKSMRASQGALISATLPEIAVDLDALWPSPL